MRQAERLVRVQIEERRRLSAWRNVNVVTGLSARNDGLTLIDGGFEMAIIIKTNPIDVVVGREVRVQEKPYEGAAVRDGDVAYLWFSEANGGGGLKYMGTVRSKKVMDQGLSLRILVERECLRSLRIDDLKAFRNSPSLDPASTLAKILYKHAHNKIAELSSHEDDYLSTRF